MQLAFIVINDPTDGSEVYANVSGIEALMRDGSGHNVVQMSSGRIHYSDETIDQLWEKITKVVEHFE
jgi:hypothetical protein